MIEQGLVLLLGSDPTVTSIAAVGGFFAQLPKDQALPSWSYLGVSDKAHYTFAGLVLTSSRRLQIDCYGYTAADVILLAGAIDRILSGFKGTLTDPDETVVQGAFRTQQIDFYDEASRTFRRMLEYEVWFETD